MKALFINAVCGIRSTGRICVDLAQELENQGYEVKIAYSRESVPEQYKKYAVRIGNKVDVYWHALMTRLFDDRGYWSRIATKRFLKWADDYNPDILWLHNIHDYVINIEMLFSWIKSRPKMAVKWTQHDCWAFTGHCFHFTVAKCNQWKYHCSFCPKQADFQHDSLICRCSQNFDRKKRAFCGVNRMTIVTPSKWLADLIKDSFLKDYSLEVVNNTVDTNVFKPTPSDFRKKFNISSQHIVLGVSSIWSKKKGLFDFYKLRTLLDESFVIVLVGLTKKQIKQLPKGIIGICRTNCIKELAEIYTAADVFLNLTYEDTFPTVNLESQACGTPCITYRSGGSPESVPMENVVDAGDLDAIKATILRLIDANI